MRIPFDPQARLDCQPIVNITLNTQCRDEIIPILAALQHIYQDPQLRGKILRLVAKDVNGSSSPKRGRNGMDYWEILVLAAVRLGLNVDYDRLQDLAENHRALRHIMGLGDWEGGEAGRTFDWRRIRDNICLVRPETIKQINDLIVTYGHQLVPHAAKAVRGDSFVVETNVHYPTESSLIVDGLRKMLPLLAELAVRIGVAGWRQHKHWFKKVKRLAREIGRISVSKGANYQTRLQTAYGKLLEVANDLLARARQLRDQGLALLDRSQADLEITALLEEISHFLGMTERVCDTARRRVLERESVPNSEKLFSIFEPETQLIKRGKAAQPVQFGHVVLVIEDQAGFICDYEVLAEGASESSVVVPIMKRLQKGLKGRIERASFDRGCHSPDNQAKLAKVVKHPCIPEKGREQAERQAEQATIEFRQARQRHPGIESAIGALQSGNGQKRCRDRTHPGYERYVGLGVLGRNLHVLGKLVIAHDDRTCLAAHSRRKRKIA